MDNAIESKLDSHERWLQGKDGQQADFRDADLSGINLRNRNLSEAKLRYANLADSDLQGCNFSGADVSSACFRGAQGERANFSNVTGWNADFCGADLKRATFAGSKLSDVIFDDADLSWADLSSTDLRWASMASAKLTRATLNNAELPAERGKQNTNLLSRLPGLAKRFLGWSPGAFVLDESMCVGTRFPRYANDRWSVLRRAYTGQRLLILIVLTIAAFLPLGMQVVFWFGVSSVESVELRQFLGSPTEANEGGELRERRIASILVGTHRGVWSITLNVILLSYNVIRALLTWFVSPLREEEERTGRSPALSEYRVWWAFHVMSAHLLPVSCGVLVHRICTVLTTSVLVPF